MSRYPAYWATAAAQEVRMDGMTFFLLLLLGMTFPIVAIAAAILIDMAVMAWMAISAAYRGITDWGHGVRVHWARAAHP